MTEQSPEPMSARLLSNSFWLSASELFRLGVTIACSLSAARILSKEDFGLMGIVMLTIAVLNTLTQTGFEHALVQRKEQIDELLDAAWTWQILRGVGLSLSLVLIAPLLARWYELPVLTNLLMLAAVRLLLLGFVNVGIIYFRRDLVFKKVFTMNLVQALTQLLVTLPAIFIWQNVWALLSGVVAEAFALLILSYTMHDYRPKLEWSKEKLRELGRFGKWITGITIMGFIVTQGDDIFVSKYLGAAALGVYQLTYTLSNTPATKITHIISQVSFPTYSRLQDNPQQLRATFIAVMRTSMLLSGTLSVLLAVFIPEFVSFVLSAKWAPIIPLLRILVISAFIRSFAALAGALFQACGRPSWDLKMQLPRLILITTLIWPACAWAGLEGACWLIVAAISSCLPVWFRGVRTLTGLSVLEVLSLNRLVWVNMTLLSGAMMWGKTWWHGDWYMSVIAAIFGGVVWLIVMLVIGRMWPSLDLVSELRRLKPLLQRG